MLLFHDLLFQNSNTYSFFSINSTQKLNRASELSGLAQDEYNKEVSDFTLTELQEILDNYEKMPAGAQSYIYLIYDSYINNDIDKLNRLLNTYSVNLNDPLLNSSLFETNANILMNDENYINALSYIDKSLKINDIHSLRIRFNISKARIYIEQKEYEKADYLLGNLKKDNDITSKQKDIIDELISYISHKM